MTRLFPILLLLCAFAAPAQVNIGYYTISWSFSTPRVPSISYSSGGCPNYLYYGTKSHMSCGASCVGGSLVWTYPLCSGESSAAVFGSCPSVMRVINDGNSVETIPVYRGDGVLGHYEYIRHYSCALELRIISESDYEILQDYAPSHCFVKESDYNAHADSEREKCGDAGGAFDNSLGGRQDNGFYCVVATCNDNCNSAMQYFYDNYWQDVVDDCCRAGAEPTNPQSTDFAQCVNVGSPNSPGVHKPSFSVNSNYTHCTESPAGSGSNFCGVESPSSDSSSEPSSDSGDGPSSDSGSVPSSDSSGPSSGSGPVDPGDWCDSPGDPCCGGICSPPGGDSGPPTGDLCDDPSYSGSSLCAGYRSSASSGDSPSSGSGCHFWCDCHPGDPLCSKAGYDDFCSEHPNDAYCAWSSTCSANPGNPHCVNPQPPPYRPDDGGGGPSGGGSSSPSGDGGGVAGASCKDLKSCDWSTYEEQLKQTGIHQGILDAIKDIFPWLQRKGREDSLLAEAGWLKADGRHVESMRKWDTIGGLIYEGNAKADSTNAILRRIDSMGGIYFDGGSKDGYPPYCYDPAHSWKLSCGGDGSGPVSGGSGEGGGSGGGGADLSGVIGGISNLGVLLGRIDSSLSAGNGDIVGILENAFGDCDGDGCGSYDGAGDGALSGLDTSGLSKARWDSLLSSPGSGGLEDSVMSFAGVLRERTRTPFADGMQCPAERLSVDPCLAVGGSCRRSLCDPLFYVMGRHVLEWFGVMLEFAAWLFFLARIA